MHKGDKSEGIWARDITGVAPEGLVLGNVLTLTSILHYLLL